MSTLMIKNVMNQLYNNEPRLDPKRSTMNPLWMYDEENEDWKKEELMRNLFPQLDQPTKLITADIDEEGQKVIEGMKSKQERRSKRSYYKT